MKRGMMFGVLEGHDALVKLNTLSRSDLALIEARRLDANPLSFAVLRHPRPKTVQVESGIPFLVVF
jgi:hypothetical protein